MDKEALEKRLQVSKRVTKSIYMVGRNQGKRNSRCSRAVPSRFEKHQGSKKGYSIPYQNGLVGHFKDFAFYSE